MNFRSECPETLREIVAKATAKTPDDRFQTALELSDSLSDFLHENPERISHRTVSDLAQEWQSDMTDDDETFDDFVLPTRPLSKEFMVPSLATNLDPSEFPAPVVSEPDRIVEESNPQIVTASGFQRHVSVENLPNPASGNFQTFEISDSQSFEYDDALVDFDESVQDLELHPIGDAATHQFTPEDLDLEKTHQVDMDFIEAELGHDPHKQVPGREYAPTEQVDFNPDDYPDYDEPTQQVTPADLGAPTTLSAHLLEPLDPNVPFSEEPTGNNRIDGSPQWDISEDHKQIKPPEFIAVGTANPDFPASETMQRRAIENAGKALSTLAEKSDQLGVTGALTQAKDLAKENLDRMPAEQKQGIFGVAFIFGGMILLVFFMTAVLGGC